jgi:hypothetical protein
MYPMVGIRLHIKKLNSNCTLKKQKYTKFSQDNKLYVGKRSYILVLYQIRRRKIISIEKSYNLVKNQFSQSKLLFFTTST